MLVRVPENPAEGLGIYPSSTTVPHSSTILQAIGKDVLQSKSIFDATTQLGHAQNLGRDVVIFSSTSLNPIASQFRISETPFAASTHRPPFTLLKVAQWWYHPFSPLNVPSSPPGGPALISSIATTSMKVGEECDVWSEGYWFKGRIMLKATPLVRVQFVGWGKGSDSLPFLPEFCLAHAGTHVTSKCTCAYCFNLTLPSSSGIRVENPPLQCYLKTGESQERGVLVDDSIPPSISTFRVLPPPIPAPKVCWGIGDHCEISDNGNYFRAIVVDTKPSDEKKTDHVQIHFVGWHSSHDTWVHKSHLFVPYSRLSDPAVCTCSYCMRSKILILHPRSRCFYTSPY